MSFTTLEVERSGPVARVWLSRPDCLNALDTTALEEIAECFTGFQTDFDARVVVLGGRGRSFCAGADRKAPPAAATLAPDSGAGPRERRHAAQLGRRALAAIEGLEAVTLARLHGHAIGGGLCLALACDFRVAAEGTQLRVPEVELGIPLTWGATPRLVRDVGAVRAREILLLCEAFDARRALDWGLLHRVVPGDELDACVDDLAARLAAMPGMAVHMTKTQLRGYAAGLGLGDPTEADGDQLLAAMASAEARRRFGGD